MVDRVTISSGETGPEAPQPAAPVKSAKPEWLPEKFWDADKGEANVESLSKSYGELEKKQGQQKAPEPDKATEEAKGVVENAGLNFEALQDKFYEKGELEETDYSALQKAGIPKHMVDNYIEGVKAQARSFADQVVGQVGGKEQYAEMTKWAQDNMSEDEISAYNQAVNSGDYHRVITAVKALRSDFQSARGSEPSLVSGKQSSGPDAYETWAQVTADMRRPEYNKDAAFRKQVEQRLARSQPR
jgi:hypothetical protein